MFSPIHFVKKRYRDAYHLNFRHAKKLFVFDLLLSAATIMLFAGTAFWFFYRPAAIDLASLRIIGVSQRFKSGDSISFTVGYENKSDIELRAPFLTLALPSHFILESAEPSGGYDAAKTAFTLDDLTGHEQGEVRITGRYFATPNTDTVLSATINYQTADDQSGLKVARAILTARDSILATAIEAPRELLAQGETLIKITLKNNGDIALTGVALPLANAKLKLKDIELTKGEIINNVWRMAELSPDETQTLTATIQTDFTGPETSFTFVPQPSIAVDEADVPQLPQPIAFSILHPKVKLSAAWDKPPSAAPGEVLPFIINIENSGATLLRSGTISLPFPSEIIDTAALRRLNPIAKIDQSSLTLTSESVPALAEIKPQNQATLILQIPISKTPRGGTDLALTLTPRFSANVSAAANSPRYVSSIATEPLRIGTAVTLSASARYFTPEGDQLGRGPLPPVVGQETKYWLFLQAQNGTSSVAPFLLTTRLAPGASFTGRGSVTVGNLPIIRADVGQVNWSLPEILPHETAGAYFEVAVTPKDSDRGKIPTLAESITITGRDRYIDQPVNVAHGPITAALEEDPVGRSEGTHIL